MKSFPSKRRLLKRHGSLKMSRYEKASEAIPADCYKFDEATGLMYTEKTAIVQASDDRNWNRLTRVDLLQNEKDMLGYTAPPGTTNQEPQSGARSLQQMTIETILGNINDVTIEGLQYLPVQLVQQIWVEINKRSVGFHHPCMIFESNLNMR